MQWVGISIVIFNSMNSRSRSANDIGADVTMS